MIRPGIKHPLCAILVALLAAPSVFPQTPPASPAPAAPAPVTAPMPNSVLTIDVLEGENAINSIPLLSSVAVTVEVKDSNEYPVEDAAVTFTLPATGTGGTFVQGGKTFSTKSDARGQAIAPQIVPTGAGKFKITVTATAGDRKGRTVVTQTNSAGNYFGAANPPRPWYKKHLVWAIAGGAVVAGILVAVLHNGSSSTVVVTPGTPGIAP